MNCVGIEPNEYILVKRTPNTGSNKTHQLYAH